MPGPGSWGQSRLPELGAVEHASVRSGPTQLYPDHNHEYYPLYTADIILQLLHGKGFSEGKSQPEGKDR